MARSTLLPINLLLAVYPLILWGDILATTNNYGSPRISSQTYGNSAVVESLHSTLDSQRNARNSLPLPVDNLTFMPNQRTTCLPGRVNYDSMFLPRPEFPKFSRDPLQYRTFITNFETHVESRIKDPKMLFCLLKMRLNWTRSNAKQREAAKIWYHRQLAKDCNRSQPSRTVAQHRLLAGCSKII